MKFHEDPPVAADYLRRAVPLMVERDIPTNPYNYALWYSHVKGVDPSLSERLLKAFPHPGSYDQKKCEKLFYEYFVKDHLPENDAAQDALVTLLAELFGSVNKAAEGTNKFGQSVQSTMNKIQQSGDPNEIRSALADLMKDASAVEQLTENFQSELQTARREVDSLREKLQSTEKDALRDELTKIGNRRAFDQGLQKSLAGSGMTSLLLLDLDHFKRCNDTYGHVMGDKILEAMGQLLLSLEDEHIQVARFGGEEFAVIFDGEADAAKQLAEIVRCNAEAIHIKQKDTSSVIDTITVSIGVAEALPGEDSEALQERADKALYTAKQQGRNRVVIADTLGC